MLCDARSRARAVEKTWDSQIRFKKKRFNEGFAQLFSNSDRPDGCPIGPVVWRLLRHVRE